MSSIPRMPLIGGADVVAHPVHEGGLGPAGRVGFFKSFLQALILGLLLCMEDGGIPEKDDTVDDRHLPPGGRIKDGILRHEDGLRGARTGSLQGSAPGTLPSRT